MNAKICVKFLLFLTFSLNLILINSCSESTSPKLNQFPQLFIENGTYKKIENSSSDKINYEINFTYYVTGKECLYSGYTIELDTLSVSLRIDSAIKLVPNSKYIENSIYKIEGELKENPRIKMEVYDDENSETYKAEYVLQFK